MTIFKGTVKKGLKVTGEENYYSVPGLAQYNDIRELTTAINGRLAVWGDKSGQANSFSRGVNRPYLVLNSQQKPVWAMSDDVSLYLNSTRKDYNFLHNGSPCAIYYITKNTWSTTVNPANSFGPLNFGVSTGVGLQGILQSNQNNGRFGFILRGAATAPAKQITNLLLPGHANYTPSGTICIQSFINYGNSIKLTYGNASLTTTPFFTNPADYPQGDHSSFSAICGVAGIVCRVGLILIYNWTGRTPSEVSVFDTRINTLLNADLSKFIALDI